jgi:VWFA-related protein
VTSRLVQISVIAQDKNGNPVQDLTREDFKITDNKHAEPTSVFSLDSASPVAATGQHTRIDPLTIENRSGVQMTKSMAVSVVVVDGLNTSGNAFLYGKVAVVKFLKDLQPGDPVALYLINGPQARVIHDFTADASSLIRAAKEMAESPLMKDLGTPSLGRAQAISGSSDPHFGAMGGMISAGSQADTAAMQRLQTEWTLTALEAIARHLTGVPGRKNLIWVSSGFPIAIGLSPGAFKSAENKGNNQELFDYTERTQQISRLLAEAQVAVYPIDPVGVKVDDMYGADLESRMGAAQVRGQQASGHMVTEGEKAEPGHRTMLTIAKQTGGMAFFNNDVAGNIRKAAGDGRISYTLGFYPADEAWDGKYHSLKVTVDRPGVEIRTRSGYFAKAVTELASERKDALRLAVASPLEGEAIGVKVKVPSNPLTGQGADLVVSIDPRDIHFDGKGGKLHGEVDVVFAQQMKDGKLVKGEQKTIECDLSNETYQSSLMGGLTLPVQLTIDKSAFRLRIVVRDTFSGAVGSVSIPVRHSA